MIILNKICDFINNINTNILSMLSLILTAYIGFLTYKLTKKIGLMQIEGSKIDKKLEIFETFIKVHTTVVSNSAFLFIKNVDNDLEISLMEQMVRDTINLDNELTLKYNIATKLFNTTVDLSILKEIKEEHHNYTKKLAEYFDNNNETIGRELDLIVDHLKILCETDTLDEIFKDLLNVKKKSKRRGK